MGKGTRIYLVGFSDSNAPYGVYYFSTDYGTLKTIPPQVKVTCNSIELAISELGIIAQALSPNTYELGKFRLTQREGSTLHVWEVFKHQ